jgi:hypothetical protein
MPHSSGPEGKVFVNKVSLGYLGRRTITTALRWSNPRGALHLTFNLAGGVVDFVVVFTWTKKYVVFPINPTHSIR